MYGQYPVDLKYARIFAFTKSDPTQHVVTDSDKSFPYIMKSNTLTYFIPQGVTSIVLLEAKKYDTTFNSTVIVKRNKTYTDNCVVTVDVTQSKTTQEGDCAISLNAFRDGNPIDITDAYATIKFPTGEKIYVSTTVNQKGIFSIEGQTFNFFAPKGSSAEVVVTSAKGNIYTKTVVIPATSTTGVASINNFDFSY